MKKKHAKIVKLMSEMLLDKPVPEIARLLELIRDAEKDMERLNLAQQ